MGIQGLIPLLKSIQKPIEIKKYAGQVVAVDGHCWLHRGTFGCASDIVTGVETNAYVYYFMSLVKMLLFFKVVPIIVFDGQPLPIKQITNEARAAFRASKIQEGKTLLKEGKIAEADKCFQQSISITPLMVAKVIKELDRLKVQHVVSPYEADSQLAYLLKTGQAKAVISEDSDLLAFGCSRVIFKLKLNGEGFEMAYNDIFDQLTGINNPAQFRYMCILSGCDYLPSLPGIGLKKAQDIVQERKTIDDIIQVIRNRCEKEVADEYIEKFIKANFAFLYQFVFDPNSRIYVRSNPLPKNFKLNHLSGLGTSPQNHNILLLESNRAEYLDYERMLREANKENIDPFVDLNPCEFDEFEFDDETLKDMDAILTKAESRSKPIKPTLTSVEPIKSIPTAVDSTLINTKSTLTGNEPSSTIVEPTTSIVKPISTIVKPTSTTVTPTPVSSSKIINTAKPLPLKNITNINNPPTSRLLNVNTNSERARLTALVAPTVSKFVVWQEKKTSIFQSRPSNTLSTQHLKPKPKPKTEIYIDKENAVDTPSITHKYPPLQSKKRKSLFDIYPDPFAKVKKPFALSDASVNRQSLCKK